MKGIQRTAVLGMAALAMGALTASVQERDIVETAMAVDDFSTLVELVVAADLVETLQGEGPFTVFAPTNEAFEKVDEATLQAVAADQELLRSVLLYHVVPGRVTSQEVVNLTEAPTALEGKNIAIEVRDGSVVLNGNATVTMVDVAATNGVIHVIDNVILPPAD